MAQRGVNKVILVGNLGQDPETRNFPDGGAVTNLSLATSEAWKDKQSGEAREKTEWHRVVARGKQAEVIAQYAKKGTKLYIEGKLQTRKWQNQQGLDQYTTEIIVKEFQFLGSNESPAPQTTQAAAAGSAPAPGNFDDFDDDIPF